jgi:hypothetical protein
MIKTKLVPFDLDWEWHPAPDTDLLGDPEQRATWGYLTLRIGSDVVTLVGEPGSGSYRRYVAAPLYPLAEWIAFNWWSLVADARPGTMISQLRFAYENGVGDNRGAWIMRSRRHIMRDAADGFRWPDLMIWPEGRQTRIVWEPDAAPHTDRTVFVSRGNAVVESADFVDRIGAFVDDVVRQLARHRISGTPLQEEWTAVRGTDTDEAAFCRLAAQLGLDPYSEADAYREEILAVAGDLPEHYTPDFFDGVGKNHLIDRLSWIRRAQQEIGAAHDTASNQLAELRAICADLSAMFYAPGAKEDPWDIGAETALRVRAWANLSDTEPFDPAPFMRYLVHDTPYLDRGLVAIGSRTGAHGPTLVSARPYPYRPRRFLQARALWHFICDVDDDFLIVAAHTHRQHVARGFALEVLAPATGIAKLFGDPAHLLTAEDLEKIADDYGCGNIVVEHQLDNRVTGLDFTWSPDPAVLAVGKVRSAPVASGVAAGSMQT